MQLQIIESSTTVDAPGIKMNSLLSATSSDNDTILPIIKSDESIDVVSRGTTTIVGGAPQSRHTNPVREYVVPSHIDDHEEKKEDYPTSESKKFLYPTSYDHVTTSINDDDSMRVVENDKAKSSSSTSSNGSDELGSEKKKRTRKPVPGPWTEEENRRFFEGYNQFGRQWSKVAEVVKTRTVQAVSQHLNSSSAKRYLERHGENINNNNGLASASHSGTTVLDDCHGEYSNTGDAILGDYAGDTMGRTSNMTNDYAYRNFPKSSTTNEYEETYDYDKDDDEEMKQVTTKKPLLPNHPKRNLGPWTDEENRLFFEGYKIHGRKWAKIAEFVTSRTVQAVSQHYNSQNAKNYFKRQNFEIDFYNEDHEADNDTDDESSRVDRQNTTGTNSSDDGLNHDDSTNDETNTTAPTPNPGPWTDEENHLFLEGYKVHGRKWAKIAELITTRTVQAVSQHYKSQNAKNYFKRHNFVSDLFCGEEGDDRSGISSNESVEKEHHNVSDYDHGHGYPDGGSELNNSAEDDAHSYDREEKSDYATDDEEDHDNKLRIINRGANTPWTDEENRLFYLGYKKYGRKWAKITDIVKTRTLKAITQHMKSANWRRYIAKQQGRVDSAAVDSTCDYSSDNITDGDDDESMQVEDSITNNDEDDLHVDESSYVGDGNKVSGTWDFKVFEYVLWPKLEAMGWRVEDGPRPSDFLYYPPGVDESARRRIDYFDSKRKVWENLQGVQFRHNDEVIELRKLYEHCCEIKNEIKDRPSRFRQSNGRLDWDLLVEEAERRIMNAENIGELPKRQRDVNESFLGRKRPKSEPDDDEQRDGFASKRGKRIRQSPVLFEPKFLPDRVTMGHTSFQSSMKDNANEDKESKTEDKQSNLKPVKQGPFAKKKSTKPDGWNARVFDYALWPRLQAMGWKLEFGIRPNDRYYLPPGISREKSAIRKDYFDTRVQVWDCLQKGTWKDKHETIEACMVYERCVELKREFINAPKKKGEKKKELDWDWLVEEAERQVKSKFFCSRRSQSQQSSKEKGKVRIINLCDNKMKQVGRPIQRRTGRWDEDEHQAFLEGVRMYGSDFRSISLDYVPTRDIQQIQSHSNFYHALVTRGEPELIREAAFALYCIQQSKLVDGFGTEM